MTWDSLCVAETMHRPGDGMLPPGAGLEPDLVNIQVHFVPGLDLIYLQNNKAGCSTVKLSLLGKSLPPDTEISLRTLHTRSQEPFAELLLNQSNQRISALMEGRFFTVVRNPYVRALSGYLDKMRPDKWIRANFRQRFFLNIEKHGEFDFLNFLRCMAGEHPRRLDPHFRAQYVNTLAHHVQFDFVGEIERMDTLEAYLENDGVSLRNWAVHATEAASKLQEYYCDEAIALVQTIFAEDFSFFGYSPAFDDALLPRTEPLSRPGGISLRAFARAPDTAEQPGTVEIDGMRHLADPDPAQTPDLNQLTKRFTDWFPFVRIMNNLAWSDRLHELNEICNKIVLLKTNHLEIVDECYLSDTGKALKSIRNNITENQDVLGRIYAPVR